MACLHAAIVAGWAVQHSQSASDRIDDNSATPTSSITPQAQTLLGATTDDLIKAFGQPSSTGPERYAGKNPKYFGTNVDVLTWGPTGESVFYTGGESAVLNNNRCVSYMLYLGGNPRSPAGLKTLKEVLPWLSGPSQPGSMASHGVWHTWQLGKVKVAAAIYDEYEVTKYDPAVGRAVQVPAKVAPTEGKVVQVRVSAMNSGVVSVLPVSVLEFLGCSWSCRGYGVAVSGAAGCAAPLPRRATASRYDHGIQSAGAAAAASWLRCRATK